MPVISSDEELRLFLPNTVRTVGQEVSLFDKISPYIISAESKLADELVSPFFLERATIADPATAALRSALRPLVALTAFCMAMPALDLILTPNGFGVVQNSNVAPASASRTQALKDSLLLQADILAMQTLEALRGFSAWRDSEQGRAWGSVLQLQLSAVRRIFPQTSGPLYERYLELRPRIEAAEAELARCWISPEILEEWRRLNLAGNMNHLQAALSVRFSQQVNRLVAGQRPDEYALALIVDEMRRNPAIFPKWHSSQTARLFSHPHFRNRKDAGGYFF